MGVFDAVVAGAGPAGGVAARDLARAGARVAIVDGSHPREKPCGGGVTGRALALVGSAIDSGRLSHSRIRAARFVDSLRHLSADVPLAAGGLIVAGRAEFDDALFSAAVDAGARVGRARVTDVARDAGGLF